MNTDCSLSELFDRYLENDLNIFERQEFDRQLKEDLAFAERFRLHKEVDHALIEDDILRFRKQLENIGTSNSELQRTPMVIAEEFSPDIDNAILEQDVMALRNQLNRIHTSVFEEVDPVEISGYDGIENAILNQDSDALSRELAAYEDLMNAGNSMVDSDVSKLHQAVDKAIMEEDVMSLRANLAEIGDRVVAHKKHHSLARRILTYIPAAAAALVIIMLGTSILFNQNSPELSSDQTFKKYFQAYDGISTKRGPSDEATGIIELGIQKYNKGDFSNARELFDLSLNDPKRGEIIHLYAGTSALFMGDPDGALTYFANWDENSPSYDQIEWYSAGCYLSKKEIEKAKAILKRISENPENIYQEPATKVLKEIGK
ncbi:MAG: hypothetical protein WC699_01110 [Bacteroidales bacterium]|jgi:hypothetical protein